MMRPVVSAPEIPKGARLLDVRWSLAGADREAYRAGHIPGAIFVDLDQDLAAPAGERGRHPLPTPDAFAARMSALGVGDDTPVVAYDDIGGGTAARVVWMLRALGRDAALLDGGLAAWSGALEQGEVEPAPARFTPRPWPAERLIAREQVGELPLLDARAPERYRGEIEPVDPVAGHIPGAINLFWKRQLDDEGRFKPPEALRDLYERVGVDLEAPVAVSCGSGVTACHLALVLEQLGARDVRLYPGSWSEWCAHMPKTG